MAPKAGGSKPAAEAPPPGASVRQLPLVVFASLSSLTPCPWSLRPSQAKELEFMQAQLEVSRAQNTSQAEQLAASVAAATAKMSDLEAVLTHSKRLEVEQKSTITALEARPTGAIGRASLVSLVNSHSRCAGQAA